MIETTCSFNTTLDNILLMSQLFKYFKIRPIERDTYFKQYFVVHDFYTFSQRHNINYHLFDHQTVLKYDTTVSFHDDSFGNLTKKRFCSLVHI